jgi:hypothetical protein
MCTNNAEYISDMAKELASLAETENWNFLGYLLRLAEYEAEALSKRAPSNSKPPKSGPN